MPVLWLSSVGCFSGYLISALYWEDKRLMQTQMQSNECRVKKDNLFKDHQSADSDPVHTIQYPGWSFPPIVLTQRPMNKSWSFRVTYFRIVGRDPQRWSNPNVLLWLTKCPETICIPCRAHEAGSWQDLWPMERSCSLISPPHAVQQAQWESGVVGIWQPDKITESHNLASSPEAIPSSHLRLTIRLISQKRYSKDSAYTWAAIFILEDDSPRKRKNTCTYSGHKPINNILILIYLFILSSLWSTCHSEQHLKLERIYIIPIVFWDKFNVNDSFLKKQVITVGDNKYLGTLRKGISRKRKSVITCNNFASVYLLWFRHNCWLFS